MKTVSVKTAAEMWAALTDNSVDVIVVTTQEAADGIQAPTNRNRPVELRPDKGVNLEHRAPKV